ncbi:MAG: hypothetical protein ABIW76_20210 [Fibrobacteria bacterium]
MYLPFIASHSPQAPGRPFRLFSPGRVITLILLALGVAWSKPSTKSGIPAQSAQAAAPAASGSGSPRFDSAGVHRLYLDGDFDAAIAILEDNLKETRAYRHEDSIFIFKHLGVMYAAQNETREKGKYYMHKLLSVEPTAKIMDMYASDMIYMIFKNIQEEFEQNRKPTPDRGRKHARADSMPVRESQPEPEVARPRPQRATKESASSGKKWVWTGVAVTAVAAGVGAYFIFSAEPQSTVTGKEVQF